MAMRFELDTKKGGGVTLFALKILFFYCIFGTKLGMTVNWVSNES